MGWGRFGKAQNKAWGGVWAANASQTWGGLGWFLGKAKTNHEKGVGCFMVPKGEMERVWEGFGLPMCPKNGVGRM